MSDLKKRYSFCGEPPLDPPEPVDHEAIRKRRDQKQADEKEVGATPVKLSDL